MPHTFLFASIRPGYEGNTNEDQEKVVNALKESVENLNKEAKAAGIDGLKGHRSVGGIRASVYNAFPIASAQALANFMRDFAARNG